MSATDFPFSSCINRRQFIGSSALLAGVGMGSNLFSQSDSAQTGNPWLDFNPLFDMKLKVRFVITGVIHDTAHEGPCRTGRLEDLTREKDMRRHLNTFKKRKQQINARTFPAEVEVLETVDFQMLVKEKDCDFKFPAGEMKKVEKDIDETDLLIALDGFNGKVGMMLAEKYRKPVATIAYFGRGNYGAWVVDIPAGLRHLGLEGYLAYDWDDMDRILRLLWVKKAFAQSSMLVLTDRYGTRPHGMGSTFYHFDELKEMYGMGHEHVPNQAAVKRMESIKKNPAVCRKTDQITEALVSNANATHMKKEFIRNSVIFYQAVKSLMDEKGCNCFGTACRELCPLEISAQYKMTPCLTHTLLKDSGYPSVCQLDFNALIAMMTFSYMAKKSTYMGNPEFYRKFGNDKNIVQIFHDVPGMKMKGFENQSLPYEIRNFTEEGWGVTVRYDFKRDKNEVVTLGRFDPSFTKIMVTKGTIHSGRGMHSIGCSLGVYVKVRDSMEMFNRQKDFGSHLVMVYGDYIEDVRQLGEMMNFKVIEV